MSVSTIQITAVKTYPIRVNIKSPVATGYFTGHAKVRSKTDFDALAQAVSGGEYEGRDEEALRELYDHFDGFGDSDGFAELLTGAASAYLYPAAIAAYFEHFGEARQGNSGKRRSR